MKLRITREQLCTWHLQVEVSWSLEAFLSMTQSRLDPELCTGQFSMKKMLMMGLKVKNKNHDLEQQKILSYVNAQLLSGW